jgi:hypothetical protein
VDVIAALDFHAMWLQDSSPIIVKIVEPEQTGWADVLFGALGLTLTIVLLAIVVGLAIGALMFWLRSRS